MPIPVGAVDAAIVLMSEALAEAVREVEVAHADEAGWRVAGAQHRFWLGASSGAYHLLSALQRQLRWCRVMRFEPTATMPSEIGRKSAPGQAITGSAHAEQRSVNLSSSSKAPSSRLAAARLGRGRTRLDITLGGVVAESQPVALGGSIHTVSSPNPHRQFPT
ncbi:MAG: hypothetical protein ACRDPE_19255 [Solirubrobacterales bacterium]